MQVLIVEEDVSPKCGKYVVLRNPAHEERGVDLNSPVAEGADHALVSGPVPGGDNSYANPRVFRVPLLLYLGKGKEELLERALG